MIRLQLPDNHGWPWTRDQLSFHPEQEQGTDPTLVINAKVLLGSPVGHHLAATLLRLDDHRKAISYLGY